MVILWDLLLIRRGSGGGAYNRRSFIGSQAVEAGVPVVLIGHTDRVTHMSYKSSGAIETASLDGTVRIWIRRAVETEASMPPLIRSKSYTPSPGFGAGRGSARGLGKMDSENDIFSTMSPKRGLNSEKSEGVADRSVFTCRAVLKVFDSNGDDTCGIDLCTISTYVPDPCHYAMKIAGSSKSTPCKSTPESVRYPSKTGSISKLMNDKLEKDAKVEEVLSASLSHSQDQITNLEGAAAAAAAAVGGVSDTKSWLIAVSLGGTIRAYTTPTFAPLQLSDTQTF